MIKLFKECKYCKGNIEGINEKFDLVKCKNCQLIFARYIFDQNEFEETYNKLYNSENPKYRNHSIIEYENLKKGIYKIGYNRKVLINKYVSPNANILEVGSGNGLTGCYIRNKFPNSEFTGIELDKKISEKAQSFGLNILIGDFSIMSNMEEKYDVVLMWEVLEHIQDLKKCIELISNRLKPGGKFIFSVPNFNKRNNYKNRKDSIYQDAPPIHLNFFTKESIKKIFNSEDFKIKSIKKKKLPYLSISSVKKMFLKIVSFQYEGPTLFCIMEKKQ